jgi:hypothetical protein
MQRSKLRISLRMLALVGVGFFAWVAFQSFLPAPGPAKVTLTLVGYTNGASGIRLAVFAVTNVGSSEVQVYAHCILTPSPSEPGALIGYFPGGYGWQSTLDRNASGRFTLPPPTNHSSWKMEVMAYNDVRIDQVIQRFLTGRLMRPSDFRTDWIKAEN